MAELMVLGFISLLLTFGQSYIVMICISEKYANTMLPCPIRGGTAHGADKGAGAKGGGGEVGSGESEHHRRLLWYEHRILAGGSPAKGCKPVSLYYPPRKLSIVDAAKVTRLYL